jgi:hypothetical protein
MVDPIRAAAFNLRQLLPALEVGIAAFLTGQWKKASVLCERAAIVFREECTGVMHSTIAYLDGNAPAAVSWLDAALAAFESADMHLYAAVCRRRISSLVGGDHG